MDHQHRYQWSVCYPAGYQGFLQVSILWQNEDCLDRHGFILIHCIHRSSSIKHQSVISSFQPLCVSTFSWPFPNRKHLARSTSSLSFLLLHHLRNSHIPLLIWSLVDLSFHPSSSVFHYHSTFSSLYYSLQQIPIIFLIVKHPPTLYDWTINTLLTGTSSWLCRENHCTMLMDHVVQFIRCFGTSWITHSPNFTLRIQRASQCYLCIKVQLSLVHNRAHFETDTTCTLTWSTPPPMKVVHWQWPPISPRSKQFTRQQVNIIWKHSQGIVKTCVIAYGWITLAFCVYCSFDLYKQYLLWRLWIIQHMLLAQLLGSYWQDFGRRTLEHVASSIR